MNPKQSPVSISISPHTGPKKPNTHLSLFYLLSFSHPITHFSTQASMPKLTDLTTGVWQSVCPHPLGDITVRSELASSLISSAQKPSHSSLSLWHARVSLLGTWNWRNSAGSLESGMIAEWMPHEYGEWRTSYQPRSTDYFHKRC